LEQVQDTTADGVLDSCNIVAETATCLAHKTDRSESRGHS